MSSGTSSDEEYEEHNVGNLSFGVVEQGSSGLLINLFLEDWELCAGSSELSSDIGLSLSGDARRLVVCLTCCQCCCPLAAEAP